MEEPNPTYELPPDIAKILATNYDELDIALPPDLAEEAGGGSVPRLPDLDSDLIEDPDSISLEVTKQRVRELERQQAQAAPLRRPTAQTNTSSLEDFVRNFLARAGLTKTLETFQSEWLEVHSAGGLPASSQFVPSLPDALCENQALHSRIQDLEARSEYLATAAEKARAQFQSLRRERDFHRAKHRRAYQEKQVVVNDLRRLREHCTLYEPIIRDLTEKYDSLLRTKMLVAIQRDRFESRVHALEETIRAVRGEADVDVDLLVRAVTAPRDASVKLGQIAMNPGPRRMASSTYRTQPRRSGLINTKNPGNFAAGGARAGAAGAGEAAGTAGTAGATGAVTDYVSRKASFATEGTLRKLNPLLRNNLTLRDFDTVADGAISLASILSLKAHESSVTSVDLHQNRPIFATASADGSWKVFTSAEGSTTAGQLVLSGSGHSDFVSSARFCPSLAGQSLLCTTSADSLCKVWNIATQRQVLEMTEHTGVVWGCDWHCTGNIVATCSQDTTCRLWDVNQTLGVLQDDSAINETLMGTARAERDLGSRAALAYCIGSLRGHTGPVLSVAIEPYGNSILTGSTDKTVKVWDPRSLTCVRDYKLNMTNSCKANWSLDGQYICCGDVDGNVALYDLRTMQSLVETRVGKHPVHSITFDRSAEGIVCACGDATIRVVSARTGRVVNTVTGSAPFECIQFGRNSTTIIAGDEAGEVGIWTV